MLLLVVHTTIIYLCVRFLLLLQNMIIAAQPTTAALPVTVVEPRLKAKPTIMIVTIVLTVVCLVQQCWPVLVCMTPALIAAMVVS